MIIAARGVRTTAPARGAPSREVWAKPRPMYASAAADLCVFGLFVSFTPRDLRAAYRRSFAPRHGTSFQIGVTPFATLTLAALVMAVLRPGEAPLVEELDAGVAVAGAVLGGWDLRASAASLQR